MITAGIEFYGIMFLGFSFFLILFYFSLFFVYKRTNKIHKPHIFKGVPPHGCRVNSDYGRVANDVDWDLPQNVPFMSGGQLQLATCFRYIPKPHFFFFLISHTKTTFRSHPTCCQFLGVINSFRFKFWTRRDNLNLVICQCN